MNQEELLKLFLKYGFNSIKKEPFLYQQKEKIGIVYEIKEPFFGTLKRVFFPTDLESAEDFLAKYSWYKKYGSKYNIHIKLDDYKIESPNVSFMSNEKELSLVELRNLITQPEENKELKKENEKEKNFRNKLKRTMTILLKIMEEKIENIKNTEQNYQKLQEETKKKDQEINEKLQEYEKQKKRETKEIESLEMSIENTFDFDIEKWKETASEQTEKEEITQWILDCALKLKELELNDHYLERKYELIRIPLIIKEQNEKLQYLEKALKKKKGLFSKKENIFEELQKIEDESTVKNIVTLNHFKENEHQRIEEKYSVIKDLDIRTVGDYLMEFDNIKLSLKEENDTKEEPKKEIKDLTYEEVMKYLEEDFANKPKEEQELLISYQYLTKNVWKNLFLEKNIQDFINQLENPNNILIKIKYFKEIDTTNIEKCKKSIEKIINKVENIPCTSMPGTINVFFKDQKKLTEKNYLHASSKRVLAPIQQEGENDITYITTLKKDASVYFVPKEITIDMENDETLVLQEARPYLFCNMQKNTIKEEKNDILKVVEYKEETELQDKTKVVTNLKSQKVHLFKKIMIERKKENA